MEITVLGEYRPFGDLDPTEALVDRAGHLGHTLPLPPSSLDPTLDSYSLEELVLKGDGSHVSSTSAKTGRRNPPSLRYSLYPPSQDGIINDNTQDSNAIKSKAPRGYDVEVVVKGSKVTWTQGGVLRKILDFTSENETVRQTLFAWFIVNNPSQKTVDRERDRERDEDYDIEQLNSADNPGADRQGRQQALVIILKDTARIYFPSGESYSVHLPFDVHKVWAMDLGMLLERKPERGEKVSEEIEGSGLPRFYMIMDPFNELQIVTLYRLPKPATTLKSAPEETAPRIRHINGVVGDIFNTCVFLSHLNASDRTVITFDLLSNRHRVWRYASSMPTTLPFSRMQTQAGPVDNAAMEVDTDADLQMRTDTYLFEIESNIQGASRDSIIFGAHSFDGSTVIGILDCEAEKLSCYQIIADQITLHLWTKPALSAVAAEATRTNQRDILILSDKGVLQLWTGLAAEFIPCHLNLNEDFLKLQRGFKRFPKANDHIHRHSTPLATITTKDTNTGEDLGVRIVEIKDAVENRVNLVLSDGTILRAQLDFNIRSSLVQGCLDAISYALPVDALWDFRHRFLQLNFDKEATDPAMDEWSNFTTTLLSYCDPSFTQSVMSSPKMQTRTLPGIPKKGAAEESDWNFFLDSEMHRSLHHHPSFRNEKVALPVSTSNIYREMIMEAQKLAMVHFKGPATRGSLRLDAFYRYILVALHLVYEDRNINLATCNEGDMAPLLMLLSHLVRWNTWVDAYTRRVFGRNHDIEVPEVFMEYDPLPLGLYEYEPPDIFRWISDIVSHPEETKPFPTLTSLATLRDPDQSLFPVLSSTPCNQLRKVTLFFTSLMTEDDGDQSAVRAIASEAFTDTQLDQLPFGVSIPLREALWKCRRNPSPDLSSDALSFIGRNDLAELASKRTPGYYMKPPSRDKDEPTKRQDMRSLCEDVVHQEGEGESEATGAEITESDITALRFGADMRVTEIQKMLQSSMVSKVRPEESPQELSEEDLRSSHLALLSKMAYRILALPVGRGIFTFGTATSILNQKCPIPAINLSAKILPSFGVMEPELSSLGGEQALNWPSFHNGVAVGLRISPNSEDVNSSWIIYNRPEVLNSSHAGFLLALGLTGHLQTLARSHVWRYLSFKHEMTSTGLLLGLACAHRGTMNTAITRVLSVHMPALLPQHGSELNLSPLTQVACVLGIGLIYMETSHRRMAEVMLSEIGSVSGTVSNSVHSLQECHSVAAGFGLGFITLGQGNTSMGLRDMKIVDVLVTYMPGSTDKNHSVRGLTGSLSETREQGQEDHHQRPPGIDMTSAGATVAMGLMYLKTNSKTIATKLDVPETPFLLDYVTPDMLMLRIICKSIVLWDSIVPSRDWALSQVPDYLKNTKTGGPPASETGPQSYYSILAGACFAMGLRFAGSGNETAYECILKYLDMFIDLSRVTRDVTTLSVAMVVAGSGRIDCLRRLRKLIRRRKAEPVYGSHLAYHMALGLLFLGGGGYTLGTSNRCVAALLCSLYPRLPSDPMDNRSHLQAFRHLWVLAVEPRCLVTRDATTGACCPVPVRVHLKPAYCQTQLQMRVGRKASIDHHYPYPQHHHQHHPLHPHDHARPGSLLSRPQGGARYTGLNTNVSQEVAMTLYSTSKLDMMTPCLLPELSTISKIEILGPRYWPITMDLSREDEDYSRIWRILKTRSISVMRHIGHLSYTEDPLGMRGILARPFPKVLTSEELLLLGNGSSGISNGNGSGISGSGGGGGGEAALEYGGSRRRKQERMRRMMENPQTGRGQGRERGAVETFSLTESSFELTDQSSASYGEDFCLTFLQDPQVASFASHLCRVRSSYGNTNRDGGDGGDDGLMAMEEEDRARAAYFTNVLYECLTMDKVEVLGVHVWLYDIANRLERLDELSWRTLWELRILVNYYDTQLKRRLEQRLSEAEKVLVEGSQNSSRGGGGRISTRRPASIATATTTMTAAAAAAAAAAALQTTLSMALTAQMLEDDGSETLIKVSRISELMSKITKHVEQEMQHGRSETKQGEKEGKSGAESWTVDQVARHYFLRGTFPRTTIKSRDDKSLPGSSPTDWFKVWLEQNEVPGPDAIRAIRRALDNTRAQWQTFVVPEVHHMGDSHTEEGGRAATQNAIAGRRKLLKQVFTLAYPAVSLTVFEYLAGDRSGV
ncbi:Anaphase-promoting complex subunit 1 [Mortierella claussenii]|nr:Anaphase-promoting complex subunit 1 [Mortierella claussenii]